MLSEGRSEAIFQFESPGMQKTLRQAKPNSIEDLIALNALYRPGPMDNIPQFISSKNGLAPITYLDPSLEDILKPTYGVIVYQEQVMKVAQRIGGFSLGKADIMRRAMGKKKEKDMAKLKVEFIKGAAEKGYPENKAKEIFEKLEPFAGYGFNKSHAAAYSLIAYKTAYCKAHYPAEFMAANLTNEINDPKKLEDYIESCKTMDIEIMPPDINYSEKYFTVVDNKIFYGLMGIKGMGSAAAEEIISARDKAGHFTSFLDFLEKVDLRVINKKVIEVSIKAGLFDRIESLNRSVLFHNMEQVVYVVQKNKDTAQSSQASLFGDCEEEVKPEISFEPVDDWPDDEKLKMEKDILGFYFSGHPLDKYQTICRRCVTLQSRNINEDTPEGAYTVLGIVKGLRTHYDKRGNRIAFAMIEDFNGTVDAAFFSKTYEKYGYLLQDDAVLGFTGKLKKRMDRISFMVDEVRQPEELRERGVPEIHIRMNGRELNHDKLEELRSFIQDNSGKNHLFFHIPSESGKETVVQANAQITFNGNEQNMSFLEQNPMIGKVWEI
jgi:DNA polymerase-3 subunit alpha